MSILRMPAVKVETGHKSHASIYAAIKVGLFTTGVPIGRRAVGWPSEEVICVAGSLYVVGEAKAFLNPSTESVQYM